MRANVPFESIYAHGFVRVAACTPCVAVADVAANLRGTLELARDASASGAVLAVFPVLVPARADGGTQRAEETVGPYELQDLYYASRFGLRPSKIAFLAERGWSDRRAGVWPQTIPDARRHEYDLAAIKRWLAELRRVR